MRQPKLSHRKTQTPIVAKQIQFCMSEKHAPKIGSFAFLPMQKLILGKAEKRYNIPERTKTPIQKILNLFGKHIVSHNIVFVNSFCLNCHYIVIPSGGDIIRGLYQRGEGSPPRSLYRLILWQGTSSSTGRAGLLAAARSRSGENSSQLFSNTLTPLRYPTGKANAKH